MRREENRREKLIKVKEEGEKRRGEKGRRRKS